MTTAAATAKPGVAELPATVFKSGERVDHERAMISPTPQNTGASTQRLGVALWGGPASAFFFNYQQNGNRLSFQRLVCVSSPTFKTGFSGNTIQIGDKT